MLTGALVALIADAAQNAITDIAISRHHVLLLLEIMRLLHYILKLNAY